MKLKKVQRPVRRKMQMIIRDFGKKHSFNRKPLSRSGRADFFCELENTLSCEVSVTGVSSRRARPERAAVSGEDHGANTLFPAQIGPRSRTHYPGRRPRFKALWSDSSSILRRSVLCWAVRLHTVGFSVKLWICRYYARSEEKVGDVSRAEHGIKGASVRVKR